MSKQRVIKDEMWGDEWFFELDPTEKLVWVFLLTNERMNIAGIYKINVRWIAIHVGLEKDIIRTILQRFIKDKKIVFKDDWMALINFHKHLAGNPSIALGVR